MATTIEELELVFDANLKPMEKAIGNAKKKVDTATRKMALSFRKVRASIRRATAAGSTFNKVMRSLALRLVAAFGAMKLFQGVMESFDRKDALGKTADKLGIATQELVALRFAAEQTAGVTGQVLDVALQRMVRRVSEASIGTGSAVKALKELGISAKELAELSPDQQFRQIADAMQNVTVQGDRVRLSMALFDTEGVALVNTLKDGSAALDEYAKQAEELGIAVSRLDAAKAEVVNDAFNRMSKVIEGVFNMLSNSLAPAFLAFAEVVTLLGKELLKDGKSAEEFGGVMLTVIAVVAQALHALLIIWKSLKVAIDAIGTVVVVAFSIVVNVITDVVSRIQGFGMVVEGVMESPGAAFEFAWLKIKQVALATIQAIITGLTAQGDAMAALAGDTVVGRNLLKAMDEVRNATRAVGVHLSAANVAVSNFGKDDAGIKKIKAGLDKITAGVDVTKAKATGIEFMDNFATGVNSKADDMVQKTTESFSLLKEAFLVFGNQSAFSFVMGMGETLDAQAEAIAAKADAMLAPKDNGLANTEEDERLVRERMISDELVRLQEERLNTERQNEIAQATFYKSSLQNKLSVTSSILGNLASLMNSKSKTMFKIGKAAAISGAIVDAWAGANKAMATLPFPVNLAAAGATLAAGMVNVQNIRSQKFGSGGGGGGAASSAGGSVAAAEAPVAAESRQTNVSIALNGNSFGNGGVRGMIDEINNATDDNVKLTVAS